MPRTLFPFIVTGIILFLDIYIFFGLKFLTRGLEVRTALIVKVAYWIFSILVIAAFWYLMKNYTGRSQGFLPKALISIIMISMISKLGGFIFLAIDDVIRAFQYVAQFFTADSSTQRGGIGRKDFLVRTSALFATSIGAAMTYGVTRGSHRYRVVRQELKVPNLPASFSGLKLLQISDIHSGSFWNPEAVTKGVNQIIAEEADMVFFTGDLVNNDSSEMDAYIDVFKRIQAPMGVYSILGNHDYGEYLPGFKKEHLPKNVNRIAEVHKKLGWDLLLNESRVIKKDGAELAVIGVENWGDKMRFSKYGDLQKANEAVKDSKVKLLLSHDPSHWRGEVLKEFKDIAVTFSGHTHGMQFGIETAGFKWSPIKYAYPEWGGLYAQDEQQLYVNRGFGYLGFPGRLGIWPEITVFDLQPA